MDKLIELLNKYGTQEEIKWKWYFVPNHIQWEGCDNSECSDLLIISKKFGFIKWLVENEKIDYEKIEEQTKCKNIVGGQEFLDFDIERDFTPYEEVLMWLAIQDEPIEFLVSILK